MSVQVSKHVSTSLKTFQYFLKNLSCLLCEEDRGTYPETSYFWSGTNNRLWGCPANYVTKIKGLFEHGQHGYCWTSQKDHKKDLFLSVFSVNSVYKIRQSGLKKHSLRGRGKCGNNKIHFNTQMGWSVWCGSYIPDRSRPGQWPASALRCWRGNCIQ